MEENANAINPEEIFKKRNRGFIAKVKGQPDKIPLDAKHIDIDGDNGSRSEEIRISYTLYRKRTCIEMTQDEEISNDY